MTLHTIVAALTHPGKKRSTNQDYVTHFEPDTLEDYEISGSLYLVADGVGGESQGDVASRYAAQKVLYEYFRNPDQSVEDRLTTLIRQAGNEIFQFAEDESDNRRMATTMVAAVIKNNLLTVANVGDSRAYLIRDDRVTQVTKDHSLLGEQIRNGSLTEEEALTAKVKNRITRSLGGERNVRVDLFQNIPLQPGDQILLCSDGLTQYTTKKILFQLIDGKRPDEAAQELINYANQQGGSDNISVIVIELTDSPSEYPTLITPRDIPIPIDWDVMSTTPGLRGFLKKPKAKVILVGLIITTLIVAVLIVKGCLSGWGKGDETPPVEGNEEFPMETTNEVMNPEILLETSTPVTTTPDPEIEEASQTPESSSSEITTSLGDDGAFLTTVSPIDGMTQIFILEGEFMMGSDESVEPDEKPAHPVYLDAYWIDQTEVTNQMYTDFLNDNEFGNGIDGKRVYYINGDYAQIDNPDGKWTPTEGFADYPVNNVSWFGAEAYCAWAGRRLPTEAEWEKAARGGTDGRKYPWGDEIPNRDLVNFNVLNSGTLPVDSLGKGLSPYGAYHMAGNVWEWVSDWHGEKYYTNPPYENPQGPAKGELHVIRGGSWKDPMGVLFTYTREEATPSGNGVDEYISLYGFRCADEYR